MPTHFEDELGLGPVMHRGRRWLHNMLGRMGMSLTPEDRRSLDPLTVNYAAWHEVRASVQTWPHYQEAPNALEIVVSPEDWDDYWGIDVERKQMAIASYVRARAAERGYWMAGDPQVSIVVDDEMEIGDVEVVCTFSEPEEGDEPVEAAPLVAAEPYRPQTMRMAAQKKTPTAPAPERPSADDTAAHKAAERGQEQGEQSPKEDSTLRRPVPTDAPKPAHARPKERPAAHVASAPAPRQPATSTTEATDTVRFVDARACGKACLLGEGNFRLIISSGDCVGAVKEGEEVPEEVNLRLDAKGFPYVEVKQFTIAVIGGRWTITNHAAHGTKLVSKGRRMMLSVSEPYPIAEGDIVYLGPTKPLTFQLL